MLGPAGLATVEHLGGPRRGRPGGRRGRHRAAGAPSRPGPGCSRSWPWCCSWPGAPRGCSFGTLGDLSPHRSLLPDALTLPGYLLLGIAAARPGPAADVPQAERPRRHPRRRHRRHRRADPGVGVPHRSGPRPSATSSCRPACCSPATRPSASSSSPSVPASPSAPDVDRPLVAAAALRHRCWPPWRARRFYMLVDAHIADIDPRFLDVPFGMAYVAAHERPSCTRRCREVSRPVRRSVDAAPRRGRSCSWPVALCVPALITLSRGAAGARAIASSSPSSSSPAPRTAAWRMFRALRAARPVRGAAWPTRPPTTCSPGWPTAPSCATTSISAVGARRRRRRSPCCSSTSTGSGWSTTAWATGCGDELLSAVGRAARGEQPRRRPRGPHRRRRVRDRGPGRPRGRPRPRAGRAHPAEPGPARSGSATSRSRSRPASAWPSTDRTDRRRPAPRRMLRDADIAMYQAKDAGGDAVAVFDASMRQRVERPPRARERAAPRPRSRRAAPGLPAHRPRPRTVA